MSWALYQLTGSAIPLLYITYKTMNILLYVDNDVLAKAAHGEVTTFRICAMSTWVAFRAFQALRCLQMYLYHDLRIR